MIKGKIEGFAQSLKSSIPMHFWVTLIIAALVIYQNWIAKPNDKITESKWFKMVMPIAVVLLLVTALAPDASQGAAVQASITTQTDSLYV